MQFMEPIHETSSLVNAPEDNGVLSDDKIDKAGDKLPTIKPCPSIIKLPLMLEIALLLKSTTYAIIDKITNKNYSNLQKLHSID